MTEREQIDVCSGRTDESLLRRLLILLTIKSAYIRAIHQPPGFDYRRMDLSLPTSTFKVDGQELRGWEIRLFKSNLGIQRKDVLVEEIYQCCAMIHRPALAGQRGTNGTYNKVYWNDKAEEAVEMLNFLKVDQIVKAYDGLVMKNGPPSNNVNGRARTSTSNSSGVPNLHGHPHGSASTVMGGVMGGGGGGSGSGSGSGGHGGHSLSSSSAAASGMVHPHGGHGHGSSHTTITNGITSSMSMTAASGSNPGMVSNVSGLRRMATEQPTRRSSEDPARIHAGLTH
jgi:hypothetical protein